MKRLALFDRDGTLNVEEGFLADPDRVVLIPGVGRALKRLNDAGWAVAIVTNQSGIGRGYYTFGQMHATNAKVVELLAREGARVDTVEWCPHHPQAGLPHLRRVCDCRKPRPGQAFAAASHLGLSVTGCVCVGDRIVDVQLAQRLGGRGILVLTGYGQKHRIVCERRRVWPDAVVPSAVEAVDWILTKA